jgi:hypothetical protein
VRHRGRASRLGRQQAAQETDEVNMALTRNFEETIAAPVQRAPKFRKALLQRDEGPTLHVTARPH